jgi:hypothetical protein
MLDAESPKKKPSDQKIETIALRFELLCLRESSKNRWFEAYKNRWFEAYMIFLTKDSLKK